MLSDGSVTNLKTLSKDMVNGLEKWYQNVLLVPFKEMLAEDPWSRREDSKLGKADFGQKFLARFTFLIE